MTTAGILIDFRKGKKIDSPLLARFFDLIEVFGNKVRVNCLGTVFFVISRIVQLFNLIILTSLYISLSFERYHKNTMLLILQIPLQ